MKISEERGVRQALETACLLVSVWSVLGGVAHAGISCPSGGPVVVHSAGGCNMPNPFEWPEGYCWCSPGRAFRVDCTQGTGGNTDDGEPGCTYVCTATNTDFPCVEMERTGTPPRKPDPAPVEPPSCRGRPVSLTTGEMFLTHTDAVVGELSLARTYNSARRSPNRYGPLGPGWNTSFDARLRVLAPGAIEARLADGTPIYYFDPDGVGRYRQEVPWGTESWIESTPDGFVKQLRAGGAETYDASGRIVSAVDSAGVATTYGRDGQGRLTAVTRRNRTIAFAYEGTSSKPSHATGPEGAVLVRYSYNAGGTLEAVDYPDGTGYRFGYGSAGLLLWVRDAAGNPIEAHEYDSNGRALTSEIADGQEKLTFAYGPNQTTVTDALNNATVYDWASVGHMYRVTKVTGPCSSCGGGGGDAQEWSYDAEGNITSYEDGLGNEWAYTYDGSGQLLTTTDPEGETTTYTYDAQGRVVTVSGPDGGLTTYTHGPAGPTSITEKVTATESRTTAVAYRTDGKPETITDARGKQTTLSYDPATADLLSVTDPLGHATTFTYDALGRRATVMDALSHTTSTTYDTAGRITRVTNPDTTRTDFEYDRSGRRTAVIDPLGNVTRYTYDPYGRLTAVVDSAGGGTRYGYDVMSNLIALTDAEGRTTSFEYDGHGRVTKTIYPGGAFETFTYDAAGRLVTKTDRKNVTTTYSYYDDGLLWKKEYSGGSPLVTDPPVVFTYDPAGRLKTAANGTDTLTWTYDLAGQLLTEQSQKNASTVAYTHDEAGNRLTLTLDGQLFVTYGYDDASRLTTITRGTNVFGFGHDAANRRTTLTYPNGVVTTYTYDDNSQVLSIEALKDTTVVSSSVYSYDDSGNRLTKTHPEYSEAYTYDPLYRLIGAERPSGTPRRWLWSYDRVGNRLTEQIDDAVTTSSYNEKNQLLNRTAGGPMRWRGTLDEPGNVAFTTVTVNGQPARMLEANVFEALVEMQPGTNTVDVQATDVSGNVATRGYQVDVSGSGATYTYDANGNLETKAAGADLWRYHWNAENQLVRVKKNSADAARFVHDPLGRRVEKVAGSAITTWTYDDEDTLRESVAGAVKYHVHGPEIDEPLAIEASGVLTHLHADGLGSIIDGTDGIGGVATARQYDAWGRPTVGAEDGGHTFTGREWDPDTELYYYRARYYDHSAARFLSADPVGFVAGVNFYSYVDDNPANGVDPSGLVTYRKPWRPSPPTESTSLVRWWWYYVVDCTLGGPDPFDIVGPVGMASEATQAAARAAARSAVRPCLTHCKRALRKVYELVGKQRRGAPGRRGSPQRGTTELGYRYDPPHPRAAPDSPDADWHINWWDWTEKKRKSGGRGGAVPIERCDNCAVGN